MAGRTKRRTETLKVVKSKQCPAYAPWQVVHKGSGSKPFRSPPEMRLDVDSNGCFTTKRLAVKAAKRVRRGRPARRG